MNILFYQDTLGVSGGEIWVVDAATRLRERGHAVSLACPAGSWVERQAELRGFPYADFSALPGSEAHHLWALTEHLIEHRVDIVFCSLPGIRAEVPLLDRAVRIAGRGRILLRLGIAPGPGTLDPVRLGVGFGSVDGIIAVSENVHQAVLQHVAGVDPAAVHVIYNGVDTQRFSPSRYTAHDRAILRDRLDVPQDDLLVTTIGRLDPIKNLPMLIDAAERMVADVSGVTFLVVGDGAQADFLHRVVADRGLARHFRFPGFVEDIPRLLHASDVMAHCSRSEGVPNVVLEAMASGLAVVATDVGGVREVVDPSRTGLLIPSRDVDALASALVRLYRRPAVRVALGREAAREAKASFSREENVTRIERLLERACASPWARHSEERDPQPLVDLSEDSFARPLFRSGTDG